MDVQVETLDDGIAVVTPTGDVDGSTAPTLQEHVTAAAKPNGRMLLDMQGVEFMSSAGLRVLLILYRQIQGNGGKVVISGLNEPLQEAMGATGFLKFFTTVADRDAGLQALRQ